MIRKRVPRRIAGAVLVVAGGLAMWLAPDSRTGAVLLAAGIALELIGLRLEHRDLESKDDPNALER